MHKILKYLVFIISFFAFNIVYASEINIKLGDEIEGYKVHLKTPAVEKDKSIFKIYNADTNELLYCIEPGVMLEKNTYQEYYSLEDLDIDLTEDELDYINKLAYFGYQFNEERSDIKWYVITQFTIWDYLLRDKGEVYFIDENGSKIEDYDDDINTLYYYADTADIAPSFIDDFNQGWLEYKFKKGGNTITYVDENNVLEKYDVIAHQDFEYKKDGNTLTLYFDKPGSYTLNLICRSNWIKPVRIYYDSSSQNVFGRGKVDLPYSDMYIYIPEPILKLTKKSTIKTSLPLAGAKYAIYKTSGYLFTEATTDENGEFTLPYILIGDYYLVETEAPYGYELNPEKIYFRVDEDIELTVEDSPILKRIDIEKYSENSGPSYALEPNTEFELYDNKTNELVTTFKTNEFGKYSLKLPYGSYTLKQITTPIGYEKIPDTEIIIDENTEDGTNIVLKNPQIVGSISLYKIDFDTKEVITSPAKFQILNTNTNEYLELNGTNIFETIDGILTLNNIPYGDYEIIEIEAPYLYRLNTNNLTFSIKKMNSYEELTLENERMFGSLYIKKIDASTNEAIASVVFGLYNANKELIGEYITTEDGSITIDKLDPGKYYLVELQTVLDYELSPEEVEIEIKDNIKTIVTVSNRHKIKVPKTGINKLFFPFLISCLILMVGIIICNHKNE